MPLRLTISTSQRVAVLRAKGPFTLMDWAAAVTALAVHPQRGAAMRVLLDRRAGPVNDSADFIWTMAAVVGEHLETLGGSRWAVLVEDEPNAFGLARVFMAAQELQGIEGAVFRDPESALTWLVDGDDDPEVAAPAPLPAQGDDDWLEVTRSFGGQFWRLKLGLPLLAPRSWLR